MEKAKASKSKQVWDCGSALYDSFELNSFQKQLDSAIISSSRTFSMPRLPSDVARRPPQEPAPLKKTAASKKLSRSFQKLLRSVFRSSKPPQEKENEKEKEKENQRYFVVYEKPNGLSTIPEIPEVEVGAFVRKTMSDRFTAASVGVYCAK